MFTGIIEQTGVLLQIQKKGGDAAMTFKISDAFLQDVAIGDSIAVNGVCLTATHIQNDTFSADVSNETLNKTSLSLLKAGSLLNVEKALTLNSRLGGHLVSGHVDALATLVNKFDEGRSARLTFQVPNHLMKYIAPKGSITLDGISLTVNQVLDDRFDVNIVPHTQERTTLHKIVTGQQVNLEVDLIARYVERLISPKVNENNSKAVTMDSLLNAGFMP